MCYTKPPQHTNARANIETQMLCVWSRANIETVAIWKSARCPRHVCWLPVAKQFGSVNQHGVTTRDGGLNLNSLNKDNQGWWLEHFLTRLFDNKDNQRWRSRWSLFFKAVPLFFEAVLCPFELIYDIRFFYVAISIWDKTTEVNATGRFLFCQVFEGFLFQGGKQH